MCPRTVYNELTSMGNRKIILRGNHNREETQSRNFSCSNSVEHFSGLATGETLLCTAMAASSAQEGFVSAFCIDSCKRKHRNL